MSTRPISAILSSPDKWCKNSLARGAQGESVSTDNPKAQSFCLLGACTKSYMDLPQPQRREVSTMYRERITKALIAYTGNDPQRSTRPSFNDDPRTTFEDIQKVLDLAQL